MKRFVAIVLALVMSLTLATSAFAAEVSKNPTWGILVTGENYADALSADNLSERTGYPVIMVNDDKMTAEDILEKYPSLTSVYVIGGPTAISEEFTDGFAGKVTVKRLAGDTRYETNDAVVAEAQKFASNNERLTTLEKWKATIDERLNSLEESFCNAVVKLERFIDFCFDPAVDFDLESWETYYNNGDELKGY